MSATVFDTPLDARSLVEASAGTGKTYALAGLFARAVIVERRRVPEILAVTFTVAATDELHARVLARLRQATGIAQAWTAGDSSSCDGDTAEQALLRRLVHEALRDGHETPAELRRRLARAVRDMDLAAITTIHGFCQRVLVEHAIDAGQPVAAAELVATNQARRAALAVGAWRRMATTTDGAAFLLRAFRDVAGLADATKRLLQEQPLLPAPAPGRDACIDRDEAWKRLHACFLETGDQARAAIEAAVRARTLSSARDKVAPLDELWAWFALQGDAAPLQPHPRLERLGQACMDDALLKTAKGEPPRLSLCRDVDDYLAAAEACDAQLLHRLRDTLRALDTAEKRAFHLHDHDDLVAAVHAACADPDVGGPLAAALRQRFPLALVDEFQDTDARQWAIFEHLFGDGGLVLVGDPKQAIYRFRGGDVETYLAAKRTAGIAPALEENFRSRPSLLDAVNTLFDAALPDTLGEGIDFAGTRPGGRARDDDLLLEGAPAVPLAFHALPPTPQGKAWARDDSVAQAADLCADAVCAWLQAGRDGRATRREHGAHRPLLPRDCAVLVRKHDEARAVREALARRGVPAVSTGRASLFASGQARDLLALLLAVASPGDERRLRAMLATPLFGLDAPALSALENDGDALRAWQDRVMQWRLRWDQHGPQALVSDVVAGEAARLLPLADGERALTHFLQLGELMQEALSSGLGMRGLGLQGQVDWLRAAIAHADPEDERQWPRLESDAGRVEIRTLHGSKGLEYPLVFLPFVGIGRGRGGGRPFAEYHDDAGRRVLQWCTKHYTGGALPFGEARRREQAEEQAEDMRLLYVGMTRAKEALWVCGGALYETGNSALRRLVDTSDRARLEALLDATLRYSDGLPPAQPGRLAAPPPPAGVPVRKAIRQLRRDWWIHSFSQLHRQQPHGAHALADEAPAEDEVSSATVAPMSLPSSRFGGVVFGNTLHAALEHSDFGAWRDAGAMVPPGQETALREALRAHGYGAADLDDGVRELAGLLAATLNAPLPMGAGAAPVRLCDLPEAARVAEMEFHFTLAGADAGAFLGLLHAHGIAGNRRDFGTWTTLSGLMTGKIDLTCEVDGRVHVLDYKSNRLAAYDGDTLDQAMAASEYDLQALLYIVAVHRWLSLRLGDGYDYARHVGGAHYLFVRGLDAAVPGQGLATLAFDRDLVEGVATVLAGGVRG